MIGLYYINAIGHPSCEIKVGHRIGYYKVLAIDYVKKNVLFKETYYDMRGWGFKEKQRLTSFDSRYFQKARKYFKWLDNDPSEWIRIK